MRILASLGPMGKGTRWFASQVAVSVAATLCIAALFPSAQPPARDVATPALATSGKSAQRVADGAIEQTVLRFDPQQQAALASFANFTPQAGPASLVQVAEAASPRPLPVKPTVTAVLPPRRPTPAAVTVEAAAPAAPSHDATATSENLRVAGIGIPGSGMLRRYVPSGSDIAATGSGAWAATASATKSVARKVVDLGGLFGLVVNVSGR